MTLRVQVAGASAAAVDRLVPTLVADRVASAIAAATDSLWGTQAQPEAAKRLGWTTAPETSAPLVPEIARLRAELAARGITRYVLCGMGGSSLAPEVITRTAGVALTVLDSTDPAQVSAAVFTELDKTAVIISSKSGSTVETDSQRRLFEAAFRDAAINPAERIIVVTDPDSPLDAQARQSGYRVFNADPDVGGRYSALTAFGLVPSGLAGADISELLDEANASLRQLVIDSQENPALILAAAIAGTSPRRDKLALVDSGTHIQGFGDWAEQLIAESTGKDQTGILPLVVSPDASDLVLADVLTVRLAGKGETNHHDQSWGPDDVVVSGTLGAQFMLWEFATAIAGRILGINPFDQPDVESAKVAARGLLDSPAALAPAAFRTEGFEVRGSARVLSGASDVGSALGALITQCPSDGYISIQAYLNRYQFGELIWLRDRLAELANRPVTFGWGPRFLHSTGQYHKGGPARGVFLQILERQDNDIAIPDRPFSFGTLIAAQAAGDAAVLESLGRPVVSLTMVEPARALAALRGALNG